MSILLLCSLRSANFPTHFLPVVVEPGTEVGKLQSSFCGVPVGTPVGVALGDFQCSVLASISQECDAGNAITVVVLSKHIISCFYLKWIWCKKHGLLYLTVI